MTVRLTCAGGDFLCEHLDVPLVPVGDWYYIDKLVSTLLAYSGIEWKPVGTVSQ